MIDYHLHVVAHGERPMTVENILAYCEVARERGIRQLGITEHDRYLEEIDLAAYEEAQERSEDVELRLGIEIDYVPGDDERMEYYATELPYDYVIGSVHRVDGREVDRATDRSIYEDYETYELYEAYFANVRRAALSGLFDVLGHPDLIKIFRHRPERDITPILEETADAVAASGIVVDVNSAGLRKPVGEVYPSRRLLEMFHRRGVPVILSSDAHAAHEVGAGYEVSIPLVREVGYTEVTTFKARERGTLPL
ncbi:histidinol-phosphatase HisJ family protein [Rubrobacter taiwanensis]|uniref:Histidinol-phosphatase n=1 Tax=Rubrobacter taiwanensis TaxID=185139 RepID=A0A4R1B7K8_9ACTN|nr:histidinol-phosphatase HisJ family protein [Rubrobacter taiwanensis]TCJ13047.1 histidinol-phosphatase HisJ family protein [Rubrobacter taiwanensis]